MASESRFQEQVYDVCLSFAGEQRAYVERVAERLRAAGVRVFYDKFEEVDLWGKNLIEALDWRYRKGATWCVIFASSDYANKAWTNHERRSAQARALLEHAEYILPARFDDVEIPGMLPTTGYVDLRGLSPEAFADIIRDKIVPDFWSAWKRASIAAIKQNR